MGADADWRRVVGQDHHAEFLPGLFQHFFYRGNYLPIQVLDRLHLFFRASLMPHLVRGFYMHIHKIIIFLCQHLNGCLGFPTVIGMEAAISTKTVFIDAPTAMPFSKSTADTMAPLRPVFS